MKWITASSGRGWQAFHYVRRSAPGRNCIQELPEFYNVFICISATLRVKMILPVRLMDLTNRLRMEDWICIPCQMESLAMNIIATVKNGVVNVMSFRPGDAFLKDKKSTMARIAVSILM